MRQNAIWGVASVALWVAVACGGSGSNGSNGSGGAAGSDASSGSGGSSGGSTGGSGGVTGGTGGTCNVGSLGCSCTTGGACDPKTHCDPALHICVSDIGSGGTAGAGGSAGAFATGGTAGAAGTGGNAGAAGMDASAGNAGAGAVDGGAGTGGSAGAGATGGTGASGGSAGTAGGAGGVAGAAGACSANTEYCNGVDDNCNGQIDESDPDTGTQCAISGKQGPCANGTWQCDHIAGAMVCISAWVPTVEVCNGIDDNCDGQTDEGDPGSGGSCTVSGAKGLCIPGMVHCQGGQLACASIHPPSSELCNGLDDNCNGSIDEGNPGGGAPCTVDGGTGHTACQSGAVVCVP